MNRNVLNDSMISIGLTVVTSVTLVTLVLFSRIILKLDNVLLTLTVPTLISLVVMPLGILSLSQTRWLSFTFDNRKIVMISAMIFFAFSIIYVNLASIPISMEQKVIMVTHFLLIAFAEEFFYRYLIFDIIRNNTKTIIALIITSVIFAFIGHINEPFIDNLVYRLPLGVLFSIIRIKSNSISLPTIVHAIYNLLIIL